MSTEKIYKGYVILNWRNGTFRVVKANPLKKIKPSEIPVELDFTVRIPDKQPMQKVTGEIEISGTKVKEIIIETLEEDTTIK